MKHIHSMTPRSEMWCPKKSTSREKSMLFLMEQYRCATKGGHESICGSPGSVPVSHLDYVGLTQICGNTCTQVPEPMGQVSVTIQVPISILI